MRKLNKRGALSLGQVGPAALVLAAVIITIAVGSMIVTDIGEGADADGTGFNASERGNEAIGNMSVLLPVMGTVLIAAAVITLVRLFG